MPEVESDASRPIDDVAKILLRDLGDHSPHHLAPCPMKYSYQKQHEQITKKVECYPMTHTPRGRALVVTMTGDRQGWDSDGKELLKMFQYLDVHAQFVFDLTGEQLITELDKFASSQEKKVDCLFVVLMGHGGKIEMKGDEHANKEFLKTADGKAFFARDGFVHSFNNNRNEYLIDIPKIFIVQMCRGGYAPEAVKVRIKTDKSNQTVGFVNTSAGLRHDAEPDTLQTKTGHFTDYLFAFATQSGFTSLRNIREGSWFIQLLTKTFLENAADIQVPELLAQVNNNLKSKGGKENLTQVGELVSSLNKALYLFPGLQKKDKPPRRLEKPERVLELSAAGHPEVQSAFRVLGLPDHGALLSYGCYPLFNVMRIEKGRKRREDEFQTDSDINALVLLPNLEQVLMADSKGRISKCSLDQLNQVTDTWSVEDMTSAWDAAAVNQDELVVVDSMKGEVSIYNLDTRKKEVKVTGLDFPSSVAYFETGATTRFAVVEQGKHQVLVYNGTLKQNPDVVIGVLGEGDERLSAPTCCQFLDSGNLLVSDRDNHRVSEFSTTAPGGLVRHWLTREDGIKHPVSISFVMPDLWVVHSPGQKNVSKFEIFWYDE